VSLSRAATPLGLAALIGLAAIWLLMYAQGPDSYYGPSEVTRWEHSRNFGAMWLWVLVFFAVGALAIVGLVADALGRAGRLRTAVYASAAATALLFVFAWFALTAGH
jgi:hypothetical protein